MQQFSKDGKNNKDLVISIVSYNSLDFLKECLQSIFKNPPYLSYRVIVVDNASEDGTAEFLKKNYPEVSLIENKINIGFAAANNKAIKESCSQESCSDYIVLLNSDCEVYEKSLDRMVQFMEENPDVGIAGPKIINSDGSIQLSCRRFPSLFNAAAHTLLGDIFPDNPFSKDYKLAGISRDKLLKVDWVSGSCMIIRRKALDETGLLDEKYFMYVEDVDICYRMSRKNWAVFYVPDAIVMHHIAGSAGRSFKGKIVSSFRMQKSVFYFFWKNYKKSIKIVLIPALVIILGLRLLFAVIKSVFSS
jgi:GT2 family glycosyltransferase